MIVQSKTKNTNWNVSAKMKIEYSIVEYPSLFSSNDPNIFGNMENNGEKQRRLIVVDKTVERFHGEKIRSYFAKHDIFTKIIPIDASERNKTTDVVFSILKEFDNFKLLRKKEPVIAIGGGVLLDIVGLAANLYRRSVPYIRVPTTLIGLIDAGIGVKTGVNFNGHKNRIGTYYPPLVSYIDPTFLASLDERHISNGLAEILKIALVKDASLFKLLEKNGKELVKNKLQSLSLSKVILHKAITGMLEELEPNLWEHNLERLVDYGHTFSGVLEMKALNDLLHGEAVCIDMAFVSVLAYQRKLLTEHDLKRVFIVMQNMKLPIFHKFCKADSMYTALQDTTFHRDGLQRFPIPTGIGGAKFVNNISYNEIKNATLLLKEFYVSLAQKEAK